MFHTKINFEPGSSLDTNLDINWNYWLKDNIRSSPNAHSKLTFDEKLTLRFYPTTSELANLSQLAYKDCKVDQHAPDTVVVSESQAFLPLCSISFDSFYAIAFFREEDSTRHRQLVIAHRGTIFTDEKDWIANSEGIMENQLTPKINYTCTFALTVIQELMSSDVGTLQIITTGHSQGGWLAQISAFAIKYLKLVPGAFIRPSNVNIDDLPTLNPHCEVFDSPGAFPIIKGISSLPSIRGQNDLDLNLDISNFVIFPNTVNILNYHLGDIFQLKSDKDFGESFDFLSIANLKHTIKFHKLEKFVKALEDPKQDIKRVTKWPMAIFENWNTKQDYAKHDSGVTSRISSVILLVVEKVNLAIWDKMYYSVAKDYADWAKKPLRHSMVDPSSTISYSDSSFSEKELRTIDQIRHIYLWLHKFKAVAESLKSTRAIDINFVETIASKCGDVCTSYGRKQFESHENYLAVKNCALLEDSFPNLNFHRLPDCFVVDCILRSHDLVNNFTSKYLDVLFTSYDDLNRSEVLIEKGKKHILSLVLIKFVSAMKHNEEGFSFENTLILSYEKIQPYLNTPLGNFGQIMNIIVDCTSSTLHNPKSNQILSLFPEINVILISEGSGKGIFYPDFKMNDKDFRDMIMPRQIQLQGRVIALNQLFGSRPNDAKLVQEYCSKYPHIFESLFQRNPQSLVEIGNMPKTVFEIDNIYINLGNDTDVFTDFEKFKQFFCIPGYEGTLVVYCDGNYDTADLIKKLEGLNFQLIGDDTNRISNFRQICMNNPNQYVDLFQYKNGTFFWECQYNPSFYSSRQIVPPNLEINQLYEASLKRGFALRINDQTDKSDIDKKVVFVNRGHRELRGVRKDQGGGNLCIKEGFEEVILSDKLNGSRVVIGERKESVIIINTYTKYNACELRVRQQVARHKQDTENTLVGIYDSSVPVSENKIPGDKTLLVLSDEPGMGKSTTILKIANNLIKLAADNWVISIELKTIRHVDKLSYLRTENSRINNLAIIADFFRINLNLTESSLDYLALKHILLCKASKLFFVLDGFDELPKYKEKFLDMLKIMRRQSKANILISTRQHEVEKLEYALGVLHHQFVPISDLKQFLVTIWAGVIRSDVGKIDIFAQAVVKDAEKYLQGDRLGFLGVPLQLKMLSDVFLADAKRFVAADTAEVAPDLFLKERYTLLLLYEKYIERKLKIYFLQKLGNNPDSWETSKAIWIGEKETKFYSIAVDMLKIREEFGSLLSVVLRHSLNQVYSEEILTDLYATGILQKETNRPEFLHRTFAEFYLAKAILQCAKFFSRPEEDLQCYRIEHLRTVFLGLMRTQVSTYSAWVVRVFLSDLIAKEEKLIESLKENNFSLGLIHTNVELEPSVFENLVEDTNCSDELLAFLLFTTLPSEKVVVSILQRCRICTSFLLAKNFQSFKHVLILIHYLVYNLQKDVQHIKFMMTEATARGDEDHWSIDELVNRNQGDSYLQCMLHWDGFIRAFVQIVRRWGEVGFKDIPGFPSELAKYLFDMGPLRKKEVPGQCFSVWV